MLNIICESLGVEVGEEWVGNDGFNYKIDSDGRLFCYSELSGFWINSEKLHKVLIGELKPKWKPKIGDEYYIPYIARGEDNRFDWYEWYNDEVDNWHLCNGLIFKTKEEAIKKTNQILENLKGEWK